MSRRLVVPALLLPALLLAPLLQSCSNGASSTHPRTASTSGTATAASAATPAPSGGPTRSPTPTRATAHLMAWHLPYPVARAASVPLGHGRVVLAGGLLPGDTSTGRTLRLDLGTGAVAALPPLPVPVHDTAAGTVGGVPTVVGGGGATEQSLLQSLSHGRWARAGDLPTARSDLGVVEWRGRAYVIGGYDGASVPRAILRLAPSAAPRDVGSLLHGVRYAALARVGAHVYVFGGEVSGRELASIQDVDLASGRTRPAGRLPVPLGHAMAATVGDRILLLGGRVAPDRQTDAMWWYDPATGHLRPAGHLPVRLSDAAVASYRRRVWLLGGETPTTTDRVVGVTVH